jgi:hypothetical protein
MDLLNKLLYRLLLLDHFLLYFHLRRQHHLRHLHLFGYKGLVLYFLFLHFDLAVDLLVVYFLPHLLDY